MRLWTAVRKTVTVVGAVTVLAVSWLALGLPLGFDSWLDASESPARADAILCLAGGTGVANLPLDQGWERIHTSVQLFADGYAPLVIFAGRGSTDISEAESYANAAAWLGLPRDAMMLDPLPSSTAEHPTTVLQSSNGRLTRTSALLVVTSRLHSRRVLMAFKKQGFTRVRIITAYQSIRPTGRVPSRPTTSLVPGFKPSTKIYTEVAYRVRWENLFGALREIAAIVWYRLKGLV